MQEERVRYRRAAALAAVIVAVAAVSSSGTAIARPAPTTTSTTRATATTSTTVPSAPTPFVSGFTPTTVRNDFTGQVGMRITVGGSDISAQALGRSVLTGNAQSHRLSLLDAGGTVLGTASVNLSGMPAGTFVYASLASPLVLHAGASYFVMSDEVAGSDGWYDYTSQPVAGGGGQVTGAAYAVAGGSAVVGATAAQAYGVVNLQYSGSSSPPGSTTTSTTVAGTTSTTTATLAPNTSLTDTAIRRALQKGGVIRLPAGTVNIKAPLRVTKSGTKLIGAGSGATVLRMAFGPTAFGPLIALPAEWSTDFGGGNPPPASMRVSNVEISNLAIDGAREGNPNTYGGTQASTLRFGIQSTISTNTWLHDLHIYDIAGDAIGFGNGNGVNVNPLVEDVLIERSGRNGMHLGSSDGAVIRRVQILDTPGVYWANAGAGNGLDIEVEGADPRVTNTLIENSVFERPTNPGFAGYGIQITRAFGPVDGVVIRGNEFRNHQLGVLVSTASNVLIENNVFNTSPIGENNVTGGGIGLMSAGAQYGSSAVIRFNQFNFDPWQWYADSMVSVTGPGDWRVEDNQMYGATQVFRAYGDLPSTIQSARNQYRPLNSGPLFVALDPTIQTFIDAGSVRLG
jgi:Right handed beta helix region